MKNYLGMIHLGVSICVCAVPFLLSVFSCMVEMFDFVSNAANVMTLLGPGRAACGLNIWM